MDRRDFLTGGAALAATLVGAVASAHEGGPKHEHGSAVAVATPGDPKLARLAAAATECVTTGEACVRHCVDLLSQGDKTLAGCLKEVLETSAVCASLASLALYAKAPTPRLVAFARACATYCRDCAAECKKHAEHHEVCRLCMEACERCAEACETLKA